MFVCVCIAALVRQCLEESEKDRQAGTRILSLGTSLGKGMILHLVQVEMCHAATRGTYKTRLAFFPCPMLGPHVGQRRLDKVDHPFKLTIRLFAG